MAVAYNSKLPFLPVEHTFHVQNFKSLVLGSKADKIQYFFKVISDIYLFI